MTGFQEVALPGLWEDDWVRAGGVWRGFRSRFKARRKKKCMQKVERGQKLMGSDTNEFPVGGGGGGVKPEKRCCWRDLEVPNSFPRVAKCGFQGTVGGNHPERIEDPFLTNYPEQVLIFGPVVEGVSSFILRGRLEHSSSQGWIWIKMTALNDYGVSPSSTGYGEEDYSNALFHVYFV